MAFGHCHRTTLVNGFLAMHSRLSPAVIRDSAGGSGTEQQRHVLIEQKLPPFSICWPGSNLGKEVLRLWKQQEL